MNIKFEYKNINQKLSFNKINIFYGSNNSGKTHLAEVLSKGFSQKSNCLFTVNNAQVLKKDFEVIKINSSSSIEEQIKLTSKSLIRKLFVENINNELNVNDEFVNFIESKFTETNKKLISLLQSINSTLPNKLVMQLEQEDIESFICKHMKIYFENEFFSSSDSKYALYSLLFEYIKSNQKSKIIIIDDFDNNLDEYNTIKLLHEIDSINSPISFILFTNKPYSLQYSLDKYNIFTLKNNKIITLTNIKNMICDCFNQDNKEQHYTFEEWAIQNNSLLTAAEYETIKNEVASNSHINLGRMLTNNNYSFENNSKLVIRPTSNNEKLFLLYVDSVINN